MITDELLHDCLTTAAVAFALDNRNNIVDFDTLEVEIGGDTQNGGASSAQNAAGIPLKIDEIRGVEKGLSAELAPVSRLLDNGKRSIVVAGGEKFL